MLPSHTIELYRPELRDQVEEFRELTFQEGNQSLSHDKFNPDNFDGQIWVLFVDNKLVSLSGCEASHYTSDPEIAARVVRLHTLKQYRATSFGMSFLPYQLKWGKEQGFKVLWWSIDVNNVGLNAIYQGKRRPNYTPHKESYETWWKDLIWDQSILFQVDPRSDLLQYVYYFILEDGYKWKPKSNMISRRWRPNPA